MKPIDFEQQFNNFVKQWVCENKQLVKEDQLDELVAQLCRLWEMQPATWLQGKSPHDYFHEIQDPAALVSMAKDYIAAGIDIPYLLTHQIDHLAQKAEDLLIGMLRLGGKEAAYAIGFLNEINSKKAVDDYIRIIAEHRQPQELIEAAVSGLKEFGFESVDRIIREFDQAKSGKAKDCFADILSCYHHPAVFERLLKEFQSERELAMYASFLGRLGDERALPYLQSAVRRSEISYYEYETLRNAINELGEDTIEREFYGDRDYELLRGEK
ncbi:MAG: hypothetical protein ACYCX2_08940 [Christensenellales bacterium]